VRSRVYWSVWLVGSALIVLSWEDIVSPTLGWVGFSLACGAAFASYLPQRRVARKAQEWAVLTKAMVEARDHGYQVAMEHLGRGRTIVYEGLAFALRPGDEVALAAVASAAPAELDEARVLRDAEQAQACLENLARLSSEVAAAVHAKKVRVTLMSEFGARGKEICSVADGRVEWQMKRPQAPPDRLVI
jgi:hypothetical protein